MALPRRAPAAHGGLIGVRIGFHVSVSAGLLWTARHARSIDCKCLQVFVRNARGWRARELTDSEVGGFRELLGRYRIAPLVVHSCYLVNLASPDPDLRERSRKAVADDMRRAQLLGAACVVVHPGHHMGAGLPWGLRTLVASLRCLLDGGPPDIHLLLENTAGRRTELGGTWEQFGRVLDELDDPRCGLCFDTCHAHAAGYRLDSARWVGRTLQAFRSAVGLAPLRLIHLNDCRGPAGARQDLHEHIGEGTIGERGFRALLRRREVQGTCAILETPLRRPQDDRRNMRRVRRLMARAGGPNRSPAD
jgi:deoxyribonuclease-4